LQPSFKKWIAISALIGYTVLLFYLFYYVGIFNLISVIQKVNLGIFALAVVSIIVSITFHTLVWFRLLNYVKIKLSFRRTYVLYWVGMFVDNLIPGGWSGDLFKAYLLSREPDIEGGKAVASVVAKNMYEAIFNLGNMVLGLILLFLNYSLAGTILFSVGLIMVLLTLPLIVLLFISFKPEGAKKVLGFLLRVLRLTRYQAGLERLLEDYHTGMVILLENPKMLVKPAIYSFFAWFFEVFTLFLVFVSLGFLVPADKVIIVRSIAGNVEAQGYAFAGYAQIVTSALYTALGVTPVLSASVALLGGVVIFWFKTGISYAAFHCVVFASCASFVCRGFRGKGKTCETTNAAKEQEKAG
jgi:uncharacterized protein (TIRG00374 family)